MVILTWVRCWAARYRESVFIRADPIRPEDCLTVVGLCPSDRVISILVHYSLMLIIITTSHHKLPRMQLDMKCSCVDSVWVYFLGEPWEQNQEVKRPSSAVTHLFVRKSNRYIHSRHRWMQYRHAIKKIRNERKHVKVVCRRARDITLVLRLGPLLL